MSEPLNQVPGMPEARCHACGLDGYPCSDPLCPHPERHRSERPADMPRPPMPNDLSARLRDNVVDVTDHGLVVCMTLDPRDVLAAADLIDQQAAEIERLKEGLRWYADPAIYKPHPHGLHFDDRDKSYHAKALLEEKPHD